MREAALRGRTFKIEGYHTGNGAMCWLQDSCKGMQPKANTLIFEGYTTITGVHGYLIRANSYY